MEKLKHMEPKKLAIITAAVIAVLGIVGVLVSGNILAVGIIMVVLQAVAVYIIINSGSEQAQEKTQSDKYRKLFKNLPIGFAQAKILIDPTGEVMGYQVEDANNTFGSYFNLDREEFVGKVLGDSHIEVLQDINAWFKAYNTSGTKEGDLMDVEITMEKLGKVFNTVMYKSEADYINMVVIDVTEQKETEAKLSKAITDANAAYKTQAEFLANMSHEIRTPMNAIVGMSELALDFDLKDSEKNILRQIRSSGINLVGIINDILDLSKIESGKMDITPVDYDLVKLMNDIMNVVEVRLSGKPVELMLEIDPGLAKIYKGDDLRLRQILINLAGNSSKFTEQGYIKLRVEDLSKYQDKEGLKISIIDTGIGIKKEDLGKLFKAFQQVDLQTNRYKGGTGLGLSISKNLVTLMKGTISVESEYGSGSTFSITLPQERVSGESCGQAYKALFEAAGDSSEITGLKQIGLALINKPQYAGLFNEAQSALPFTAPDARLLVVDDNEVNLKVADGLLQKFGIKCTQCLSGYLALDLLKKEKFDLIFMDHQMPGMDGVETLEKIRAMEEALPQDQKSIVIVLSANAVYGAREMFLSKGFNDFISKPVQGKDFAACLSKWLKPELIKISEAGGAASFVTAESAIPENFPALPADKINLAKAVENAGGFENWLSVTKTFASSIEEKLALIQDYFAKGDYKNFTIQVHALKSAARIIGAEKLSAMAEELEDAGDKLQTAPDLLKEYQTYTELLEPVKNYTAFDESQQRDAAPEEIDTTIKNMLEACQNCDLAALEDNFALLKKIKLTAGLKEKLPELTRAVENIDFNDLEKLLRV